jgi:hypothetical protein
VLIRQIEIKCSNKRNILSLNKERECKEIVKLKEMVRF